MGLKFEPHQGSDTIFASVLADGLIHVKVKEATEGAVKRMFATDDDKKKQRKDPTHLPTGFAWEHQYTELSGIIQEVSFRKGQYGLSLQIVVADEEDEDAKPITLSLGVASNFGEDMMKKLPNINMKLPVTLAPYSFENDRGKNQRGITVTQENKKGEKVKITSYFHEQNKEGKTDTTNGYPPITKNSAKDWKKYFESARDFLVEYTEENVATKKMSEDKADGETEADAKARRKSNMAF